MCTAGRRWIVGGWSCRSPGTRICRVSQETIGNAFGDFLEIAATVDRRHTVEFLILFDDRDGLDFVLLQSLDDLGQLAVVGHASVGLRAGVEPRDQVKGRHVDLKDHVDR